MGNYDDQFPGWGTLMYTGYFFYSDKPIDAESLHPIASLNLVWNKRSGNCSSILVRLGLPGCVH